MAQVRIVQPAELPALQRFLDAHAPLTMFMRSNLAKGGLADHGERFQGTYAAAWRGADVVGAGAHFWNHSVVVCASEGVDDIARAVVAATGRSVRAIVGPYDQAVEATEALGLADRPLTMDSPEILYALDLDALVMPRMPADLRARRGVASDAEVLIPWRRQYDLDLGAGDDGPERHAVQRERVALTLEAGDTWVLERAGTPVATCSFNARLPDSVQVGGVFTPHSERSRGYGRTVVAASLAAVRSEGVQRAILFTGEHNVPAQRAYLALGFTEIGSYGIRLLW